MSTRALHGSCATLILMFRRTLLFAALVVVACQDDVTAPDLRTVRSSALVTDEGPAVIDETAQAVRDDGTQS